MSFNLKQLVEEMDTIKSSIDKVASVRGNSNGLLDSLDNIACGNTKEVPVELSEKTINKMAAALKRAVLENEQTQGSVTSNTDHAVDGAATNAARATDQTIPFSTVEQAAKANPQAHYTSETSDLIEDEPINSQAMVEALKQAGLVVYKQADAVLLNKFAELGYNHVVDTYSDQMVQEKLASILLAQQEEELIKQASYDDLLNDPDILKYL
jgi:hypothetical protein